MMLLRFTFLYIIICKVTLKHTRTHLDNVTSCAINRGQYSNHNTESFTTIDDGLIAVTRRFAGYEITWPSPKLISEPILSLFQIPDEIRESETCYSHCEVVIACIVYREKKFLTNV